MINIHPTGTARDGKVLPEKTPKPGDPAKHIIKCYQCGCSVVEDRDIVDVDSEDDGNTLVTTTVTISNDQSKLPQPLKGMATFAAASRDVVEPTVTGGCPLCGTYNPRGIGAEIDFANSIDLSNQ